MSDTETKTVRARPLRDFADAGSERRFTKGQEVDLTEGEVENYAAAGLVETVDAPAAAEEPTKPSRSRG